MLLKIWSACFDVFSGCPFSIGYIKELERNPNDTILFHHIGTFYLEFFNSMLYVLSYFEKHSSERQIPTRTISTSKN